MIEVTLRTVVRDVAVNSWTMSEYRTAIEKARLVTVERVDGLWKAVLWVDGELRVVPAGQLDEWTAED